MVLAGLTFDGLKAVLNSNGWNIVSDENWEEHDLITLKKDDESIILTVESYYYFPFVFRYLTSLGIAVPEDCKKSYDQYMALLESQNKTKEN